MGRILAVSLLLGLSVLALPSPTGSALTVIELSPSSGATVCASYIRGNATGGVWDQSTLTCTLAGNGVVFPSFCVSASPGGCTVNPMDKLVIEQGVTLVLDHGGSMAVYSEVDNYGTLLSDITNYRTIVNYGLISLNGTNQLINLPYNGFGVINNTAGATIDNDYYITNAGKIYNYGTIDNRGQFISQECSPCVTGSLVNSGTYIGSPPAPVVTTSVNLTGGNGTADQNSTVGVSVTITGAGGSNATVSTQALGSDKPPGLGSVKLNSTAYFDILVSGVSNGTARVCITSDRVTSSSSGEIQYWNGTGWVGAADQKISGSSPPLTVCGDIPVSALTGTPIVVGSASGSGGVSQTTTTAPQSVTTESVPPPPPLQDTSTLLLAAAAISILAILAVLALRRRSAGSPHS